MSCPRPCPLSPIRLLLLAAVSGLGLAASAAEAPLDAAAVHVERQGETIAIDVVMHTPAAPALAWDVLTDFDHMAGLVPGLTRSQVTQRQGTQWTVSQAGVAHWGLFSMRFESVRELHLAPTHEIRAHALSGSAKRMDSLMQLDAEPGGTRLSYHAEMVPAGFFPPGLGPAAMRHQTAEQFNALLAEMQRRQAAGAHAAPNVTN